MPRLMVTLYAHAPFGSMFLATIPVWHCCPVEQKLDLELVIARSKGQVFGGMVPNQDLVSL